jgi:hypothetical protein
MPDSWILDMKWTPVGLAKFFLGRTPSIRGRAVSYAETYSVHPTRFQERIYPILIGPIWHVKGDEADVQEVVKHFNGKGNVTVTYSQEFTSEAELEAAVAKLRESTGIRDLASRFSLE